MTKEEAMQEVKKAFEPAFANYIIIALTEGATVSDRSEDAISRQAAIDTIESWLSCDDYNEAERHIMRAMQSVLYDLPPVTPKEKTGRWEVYEVVDFGDFKGTEKYKCSKCGEKVGVFKSNFCPNCGKRMVSE